MERSKISQLNLLISTLGLSPSDLALASTQPSLTLSSRTQLSLDLQASTLTKDNDLAALSLEGWLYTDQKSLLD